MESEASNMTLENHFFLGFKFIFMHTVEKSMNQLIKLNKLETYVNIYYSIHGKRTNDSTKTLLIYCVRR